MKKLLRFIPALALAAALLTVTALACSPDDNNPEHHENVIQTDEKKSGQSSLLPNTWVHLACIFCAKTVENWVEKFGRSRQPSTASPGRFHYSKGQERCQCSGKESDKR